MTGRRAGTALRGGAAMLTLAAATVGLPVLLYRLGGSPVPGHLPSLHHMVSALTRRDNGGLFLGAVRDTSWLAWAAFTIAVLAEIQALLRGRPAPRLYLAGLQGPAGRLVAAASVAFTAPVAVSLAGSPAMAATTVAADAHPAPASAGFARTETQAAQARAVTLDAVVRTGTTAAGQAGYAARAEHGGHDDAARAHPATRTVTVRPGDCLWTIAAHYLGAGDRYPELLRLNLGRDMGHGQVFSDPSLIRPGWQLSVPGAAGRPVQPPPHQPHLHPGHPAGNRRFSHPHTGAESGGAGTSGTTGTPGAGQPQAAGSESTPTEPAGGQHEEVQQAVLFTLGMLAGAALVALERLRHRQRQNRRQGRRIALPADEDGRRMEQKLRAATPPAPPASLRDALCDLSAGVAEGGDPLPPIVGIHLTAASIEVLLSGPAAAPPPEPFTIAPGRQGMCWTADLRDAAPEWTTAPLVPGEVGDLLPGLFTAGATRDGGYLLLDLEAMRVTSCEGPMALTDRLLVTAATELASSRWSGWYDLVLAGCDELDVLGRAERCRDLDEALDLLEARSATIERRLAGDRHEDVRARRMDDPEDEDWGLTLLVSRLEPSPEQMSRLLDLADGPGGIAALVAGDVQASDGKVAPALFRLAADPDGLGDMVATITLAHLGDSELTVWPQTLTVAEYQALAGLLRTASATGDVAPDDAPYAEAGGDGPPWMHFAAAPTLADPELAERAQATLAADEDLLNRPVSMPDFGGPAGVSAPAAGPSDMVPPGPERLQPEHPGQERPGQERPEPGLPGEQRPRWQHPGPSPAARHARRGLAVNVLGGFEITGSAEPLQPKQAELVLALALHGPVGLSNSALCSLLGADADHPRPADSVRQLITRTRRRLGQAADGQEYVIHLGSGIYVLHEDVQLDWAAFSALARRGRAERDPADLRAALGLVRGEPFADCFHWWIDVALVETMRAEIVDAADLLAQLELQAGDPRAARRAALTGLSAETAAEQLWRALMRAEHERRQPGRRAGGVDGVRGGD